MPLKTFAYKDFTGGESSAYPMGSMPEKYSLIMQNCFVSKNGSVARLPGFKKVNSSPITGCSIKNGFIYKKADGTEYNVGWGTDGYIYKFVTTTATKINPSTILNTANKAIFTQANNYLIICNGIDVPYKWDGTTFSELTTYIPTGTKFKKVITHKGYYFAIDNTNKQMVYISQTVTDWTATGATLTGPDFIDLSEYLDKGDETIDIVSYRGFLVVLCKNHIFIYSGDVFINYTYTSAGAGTPIVEVVSDFALQQVINNIGVYAIDMTTQWNNDLLFVSCSGIKSLQEILASGNLTLASASADIDNSWLSSSGFTYTPCHLSVNIKKNWLMLFTDSHIWIKTMPFNAWCRLKWGVAATNQLFCGWGNSDYYYMGGVSYAHLNEATDHNFKFNDEFAKIKWHTAPFTLIDQPYKINLKQFDILFEFVGDAATCFAVCINEDNINASAEAYTFETEETVSLMDETLYDTYDNAFYLDGGARVNQKFPAFGKMQRVIFSFDHYDTGYTKDIKIMGLNFFGEFGGQ